MRRAKVARRARVVGHAKVVEACKDHDVIVVERRDPMLH